MAISVLAAQALSGGHYPFAHAKGTSAWVGEAGDLGAEVCDRYAFV